MSITAPRHWAAGGPDALPSGAVRVVGAGRRRHLALACFLRSPALQVLAMCSATLAVFLHPAAASSGRGAAPRLPTIDGVLFACGLHLSLDSLLRAATGGLLRGADAGAAAPCDIGAGGAPGGGDAGGHISWLPAAVRITAELFCSWNLCLDVSFLAGDWAVRIADALRMHTQNRKSCAPRCLGGSHLR